MIDTIGKIVRTSRQMFAATIRASVMRRRSSRIQERPIREARPNASENRQINPSTIVRAAQGDGSRPKLASVLQDGEKSANIQTGSAVICWGMSVYLFSLAPRGGFFQPDWWGT